MNATLAEIVIAHAPAVTVAAPLAGAALAALCSARLAWLVAVLATVLGAASALGLSWIAFAGGDAGPIDGPGLWSAALVSTLGVAIAIGSGAMRDEIGVRARPLALALGLASLAGWIGAACAADLVTLFVAVEVGWLSAVAFVALSGEQRRSALSGALRMLTQGGIAGVLMVLGVGMAARGAGTTELAALTTTTIAAPALGAAGFALIVFGLVAKAAAAPAHLWAGAVFGRGGAAAALLLGAVVSIGALAALLRVSAYALSAPGVAAALSQVLLVLGLFGVAAGSLQAIGASDLRRLAAYSGAAQAGCFIVCVALGSPAGYAAALVQLAAQGAAALALLGGAAVLPGSAPLAQLDGLARRAPLSAAAIAAGALSVMGAPLTLGFLGRWRFIEAGVGGGWWWTAGAAIAASLAAVLYGGRLIERMYVRRAAAPVERGDPWRYALAPALVGAIAAIALGVRPASLLSAADSAARALGAGP